MNSPNSRRPVVIMGAGLAGLSCAKQLAEYDIEFLLLEATDDVGGRIRTDVVDGCRLDRGFQVFQTAYPEAKRLLNYKQLQLNELEPGALVRFQGRWHRMSDPLRRPRYLWQTLVNPIGTWRDRLRLLRMRYDILGKDFDTWLNRSTDQSTLALLRERYRFSEGFVEGFMRPWLAGIFLEKELSTSANYFAFVFSMLSTGQISYPSSGMQAIPQQLAKSIAPENLRLNSPVQRVQPESAEAITVVLESGEQIGASAAVVATDLAAAARLTGGAVSNRPTNGTRCIYYVADKCPIRESALLLNGEGQGPINHAMVITNAVPSLAPPGLSLISVSVVDQRAADVDEHQVREQLANWFGKDVEQWRKLREYMVDGALPIQSPGFYHRESPELPDGMFVCGDYLETTSINGALKSGSQAAGRIRAHLQSTSKSR